MEKNKKIKFNLLSDEEQINEMRDWFYENYKRPVDVCPYDEGEYVYIWGGPYEPADVLSNEFSENVDEELIDELARELENESFEWSGLPEYDDYEEEIQKIISSMDLPITRLSENINSLRKILKIDFDYNIQNTLYNMIQAYSISALEAFLYEEFSRQILSDEDKLKLFFLKNADFQQDKIKLCELLLLSPKERAIQYLSEKVLWHNLDKVKNLYNGVFNFNFPENVDFLKHMIYKRHDIVHRCGKDKNGKDVTITKIELEKLFDSITELTTFINDELNNKIKNETSFPPNSKNKTT